jgi:acetyl esterase/lipase
MNALFLLLGLVLLGEGPTNVETRPPAQRVDAANLLREFLQVRTDRLGQDVESLAADLVWSLLDASMPYLSPPLETSGKVETEHSYYLYDLPAGYDATRPWPMMVSLHGNPPGHCERVHNKYWSGDAARLGFILVSPNLDGGRWRREDGETVLLETIGDAVTRFHVDWTRIYLSGYSAGGSGTWIYGARYADLFAGILVRCGLPRADGRQLANLHGRGIFVVHASEDAKCDVEQTRNAVREMRKAGIEVVYQEFPGGHDFFPEVNEPALRYLSRYSMPKPDAFALSGSFGGRDRIVHFVGLRGGDRHRLQVRRTGDSVDIDVTNPEDLDVLDVFLSPVYFALERPLAVTVNGRAFEVVPRASAKAFAASWPLYPFHAAGNSSRVFLSAVRVVENGKLLAEPVNY